MGLRAFIMLLCLLPLGAFADDRLVRLHAPEALAQTGLLEYILPRFTLKTQVRIEAVSADQADMVLGETGRAVFEGAGRIWRMDMRSSDHAGTKKLADWLRSEIGQRTIAGYAPEGAALFTLVKAEEAEIAPVEISGDAVRGHEVSLAKCTRCHAVDEATRGYGIGSTPSFGVLRAMKDWEPRFAGFYALKPHAAFTQITDVTDPFPPERPSPIAPIELTLDELEALLAYVAGMPPADLGQPIQHQ